jgi:Domain of unknown function (DUF4345)
MTHIKPDKQRLQSAFLLVTAAGLTPIALIYGIAPEQSLPWLFGIDASGVDTRHIFKAFMGLYLALVGFWIAGAIKPHLCNPALWSLFIFMVGLALGRVFSLLVDGWPSGLLMFYLFLEVSFGWMGWWMLKAPKP